MHDLGYFSVHEIIQSLFLLHVKMTHISINVAVDLHNKCFTVLVNIDGCSLPSTGYTFSVSAQLSKTSLKQTGIGLIH